MAQVFVSYCHVSPDQELAHAVVAALRQRKHRVFWDDDIVVGDRWATRIDNELASADFMLLLVSEASVKSDMVLGEIQRARGHDCPILPVRVQFESALPYELESFLGPLQYLLWTRPEETEEIIEGLQKALAAEETPPARSSLPPEEALRGLWDCTEGKGLPLPSADPRFILDTGTIPFESPYYVERASDAAATGHIVSRTRTVIVKGHRQSGKSSLLVRMARKARASGARSIYLDFQIFPEACLAKADQLCSEFAQAIARELKVAPPPASAVGADDCTLWLEAHLQASKQPLLLVLDEVDRVFGNDSSTAFFAMLRHWHNRDTINQAWRRLSMLLGHSTEPLLWITDQHLSPFNVGISVALNPFQPDEVRWLNQQLGRPLPDDRIPELVELVSGHPYLVRRALYELKNGGYDMDKLRQRAHLPRGPFGDHLRRLTLMVRRSKELRSGVDKALRGRRNFTSEEEEALLASGLVAPDGRAELRCEVYRAYFRAELKRTVWQRLSQLWTT